MHDDEELGDSQLYILWWQLRVKEIVIGRTRLFQDAIRLTDLATEVCSPACANSKKRC